MGLSGSSDERLILNADAGIGFPPASDDDERTTRGNRGRA
jgi:hypothetical protein